MAYAAAAIAVIAVAWQTYQAVDAANKQADEEKKIGQFYDEKAKLEKQNAQIELDTATYEEQQQRRRAALLLGMQRNIAGAAGTVSTTGSPLLQYADTVIQSEMDALEIRREGRIKANDRLAGASVEQYNADFARYRSSQAKASIPGIIIGGVINAAAAATSAYVGARSSTPETPPSTQRSEYAYQTYRAGERSMYGNSGSSTVSDWAGSWYLRR